jgi:hypothetical protein
MVTKTLRLLLLSLKRFELHFNLSWLVQGHGKSLCKQRPTGIAHSLLFAALSSLNGPETAWS